MIPPQFDYHAPGRLYEALSLLGSLDDAKVMSGGQSLLPMMKLRLATPANIVDIGGIPGLDSISEEGGFLRIGALVTETALEESAVVAARYPILLDTAKVIADPLVRNRATICGNVAHGDPANDHPATMLALRAQMVATGPDGGAHDRRGRLLPRAVHDGAVRGRDPDRNTHPGARRGRAGRAGRGPAAPAAPTPAVPTSSSNARSATTRSPARPCN